MPAGQTGECRESPRLRKSGEARRRVFPARLRNLPRNECHSTGGAGTGATTVDISEGALVRALTTRHPQAAAIGRGWCRDVGQTGGPVYTVIEAKNPENRTTVAAGSGPPAAGLERIDRSQFVVMMSGCLPEPSHGCELSDVAGELPTRIRKRRFERRGCRFGRAHEHDELGGPSF